MNKTIITTTIAIAGFIFISLFILAAYRHQDIKARCDNFRTQEDAQRYMIDKEAYYLNGDPEEDNLACENLPSEIKKKK